MALTNRWLMRWGTCESNTVAASSFLVIKQLKSWKKIQGYHGRLCQASCFSVFLITSPFHFKSGLATSAFSALAYATSTTLLAWRETVQKKVRQLSRSNILASHLEWARRNQRTNFWRTKPLKISRRIMHSAMVKTMLIAPAA